MVEKRVTLDDDNNQSCLSSGTDSLGPNLPPRSPIIQLDPPGGSATPRKENWLTSSRLIAQSDWNISCQRPEDPAKRGSNNGARTKIERSVSYVNDPRGARNFKSLPRSHENKSLLIRADKTSAPAGNEETDSSNPSRARKQSVTAGYADLSGGVSVNCYIGSQRTLANSSNSSINVQTQKQSKPSERLVKERPTPLLERRNESGHVIERQKSVGNDNQAHSQRTPIYSTQTAVTLRSRTQQYVEPDSDTVQSTDSGIMSQCNDGAMTSQYNPTNVRNLITNGLKIQLALNRTCKRHTDRCNNSNKVAHRKSTVRVNEDQGLYLRDLQVLQTKIAIHYRHKILPTLSLREEVIDGMLTLKKRKLNGDTADPLLFDSLLIPQQLLAQWHPDRFQHGRCRRPQCRRDPLHLRHLWSL